MYTFYFGLGVYIIVFFGCFLFTKIDKFRYTEMNSTVKEKIN